ncbi:YqgE/AlgH family protein [Sphingomonas sp.]|uniref:YqgE/AlgH family protein n=1 Tax=Sphingomonas sp. TaxID=28214 RepID=UPI003CC559F8
MDDPVYLSGKFLLAMPAMPDPRFAHAVVAMCAHGKEGAVGVGIGQTYDGLGFHDLLEEFSIDPGESENAPVHIGGPVEPRRGFVIHSRDWGGQDTLDVAGCWSLSSTVDVLRAIAGSRGPSRWLVALGYAGWGEGQLEGELTRPGWVTVKGDEALLFDTAAAQRWERGFAGAGIDPRLLVGSVGRA